MRLVLTVERYFPAVGGAERVVQHVAEGLAARGHEITVVTSGQRSTEHLNGVAVERFPVRGNEALGIRGDVSAALELIESFDPELVFTYAAQTWTTDACAVFLDRQRSFRLVLAPCGFSALRSRRYAAYFRVLRHRLPRYDALVLHSADYQDWQFATEANVVRRFVIPNGAGQPLPRAPRSERALLVTIGSHVRSKGHADFARVVRELGCHGVIVAPTRRGRELVRGCQAACLIRARASSGRLELVDGRDPSAAPRALAAASVFVFPSRIECAPLVILEAMAAGVPWVSYDVGNVRELAGGVVAEDYSRLVDAVRQVLVQGDGGLGEQGHAAWAESHRWPDIVDQYEKLFTEIVTDVEASGVQRA